MLSTALLLAASMVVGQGETPHEDWFQFLKGQWTYEYSSLSAEGVTLKGEAKYTPASNGKTVVAKGVEGKDKWIELIGWQPDKKKIVCLGYGSVNNNYWLSEYDDVTKDKLDGVTSGILPDGRLVAGKATLKRVDDNTFEVHLKVKSGDDVISDVGKFKRVSDGKGKK